MALRDQAVQIVVGALDRHAAHRDVLAEMLAALGQHDAERPRGDFGILEEQLVEVAHPVEQQAIRMGGLDLEVLLHHRRQPADGLGSRVGRLGGRGMDGHGRKLAKIIGPIPLFARQNARFPRRPAPFGAQFRRCHAWRPAQIRR